MRAPATVVPRPSVVSHLPRRSSGARLTSETSPAKPKIDTQGVNVFYADKQALFDISLSITANRVTALIGASGCGKSTFLRCINRMNDVIDGCRIEGRVQVDGKDVYASDLDVVTILGF